jgi:hypothetical protein
MRVSKQEFKNGNGKTNRKNSKMVKILMIISALLLIVAEVIDARTTNSGSQKVKDEVIEMEDIEIDTVPHGTVDTISIAHGPLTYDGRLNFWNHPTPSKNPIDTVHISVANTPEAMIRGINGGSGTYYYITPDAKISISGIQVVCTKKHCD